MSVVTVRIPTPLRASTGGLAEVVCNGSTVAEVLDDLERQHSGIKERISDPDGSIRRFINIFLGDEDIRFMDGANTPVNEGDSMSIIPAVAGG